MMSVRVPIQECKPPCRSTLKERKRRQTSTRIMEAAVALFKERGFEHTTADDIAEAAECSRSTLFRYFGTKEDILFGDAQGVLAEVGGALAALPRCADPWQAAKDAGLESVVRYLSGESGLTRECIELWFSHPAPLRRYLDISHQWECLLADFFARQAGEDPETDLASQLRAVAMSGTVRSVMRAYSVPGTDVRAAIAEAFALLESGFAASGRPASGQGPADPRAN